MIRVTADSNIYISALLFGGPPDDFLSLAQSGRILLVIFDDILNEVARVLHDKFGLSAPSVSLLRELIGGFTTRVAPVQRLDVIKEDETDNRILECALAGRSDYLVTRDKHLLKIQSFGATRILLVAEFLGLFRQQEQG